MRVLVALKQVMDPSTPVRLYADGSGVDQREAAEVMNPFDEIAVEAAISLKEQGQATETIGVTIGPEKWQESLRTALAMGLDRALHVVHEEALEPLAIAQTLAAVAKREAVELLLTGKQAVDSDENQVAQLTAGLLGWSQATFASEITLEAGRLTVVREVDAGLETIEAPLPAVVSSDLRLNEPRYASLPNIVKAKRKPLDDLTLTELGIEPQPQWQTLEISAPLPRPMGRGVESVAELHTLLKQGGLL
uniref:Electron transfer flavoprotein subunit beta n=1 Tax=Magnetococcus massalia (strain MO-1) TaxID=451514 RepID=A0A1S7LQV7_MAGMO|nr:Electron transfer flavoprotein beta-subunit (Beta-ETF) (Electron transfer flavoprotein small subunit) (ETFSS) [Candidatus Magnetococcus massalia]